MQQTAAKFNVGQIIIHLKFGYRGVVFDVDPIFAESDEWYATMAKSRPPKDQPWYHVLVDGADYTTYVAERHLAPDQNEQPVAHPLIDDLFAGFANGRYTLDHHRN